MNVLTQITDLLSDEKVPLSSALLKLKILAVRIENKNLKEWLEKELKGYENSKHIPSYRRQPGAMEFSYSTYHGMMLNQPVPVEHIFKGDLYKLASTIPFVQSVSALEELKGKGSVELIAPSFILPIITKYYRKQNDKDFSIISVRIGSSVSAVYEILSVIRHTALDLVLALEQELGYEIEMSEILTEKNKATNIINNIMSQNNFTSSGDGNIFNSGDNNKITQNIHIEKNNFEQLKKELENIGVDEANISELESIIDTEKPNYTTKKFGDKVNIWTQKMLGKALDGSWNIAMATGAAILSELLMKYYGLK